MAKDYKPSAKRSKKASKKKAAPGWLWLTAGLSIGLFVAFLVYLQGRPEPQPVQTVTAPKPEQRQAPKTTAKTPETEKRRFEFYTLLPEMEVVVPEAEQKSDKDAAPKRLAKITEDGTYELQAGSFRRFEDADSRKAALALLGVESEIQRVKLENQETWHRVRIGPYTNLRELNSVRARLQENSIETLLIRIRGRS